jgi:hypothetical protein
MLALLDLRMLILPAMLDMALGGVFAGLLQSLRFAVMSDVAERLRCSLRAVARLSGWTP